MTEALFPGLATAIGSLPHQDMEAALDLVFAKTPACPHWPQLQSLRYTEQMEIQPVEGLPGVRHLPEQKSVYVDTAAGEEELAAFYEKALAAEAGEGLDFFAMGPDYAQGFHAFLARLEALGRRLPLVKAQIVAPFSFGYTIHDQDGKPILFHPAWADACMRLLALKSLWQIKLLQQHAVHVLFFLDEPMLSAYGSTAMLTVSREEVIERLNQVVDPLRAQGAIVGMHCCGNTDWGLVMESNLDVINFDAYNYGPTLAIYPDEVNRFLQRGGWFAVGIVPTIFPGPEAIDKEDEESITNRLAAWVAEMARAGVDRERLVRQIVVTPACGCGTLSRAQSEKIYDIVAHIQQVYSEKILKA